MTIIKTCKKHGDLTLDGLIKSGKNKDGTQKFRCKKCMKEIHHENYLKNKERLYDKTKNYRKDKPEKIKEIRRIHYHATKEKHRESKRKSYMAYHKKAKEELNDVYVKQVITKKTNLKSSDIPDELVKLKRTLLLAYRRLKQEKKLELEIKINHENKNC